MAAGRDRGDLAARQLVFLLPGKRGRRVGRERSGWRRREAFARVGTRPRGPGERGPGFGALHFAAHPWSRVTPRGSFKPGSVGRDHAGSLECFCQYNHPACGGRRWFRDSAASGSYWMFTAQRLESCWIQNQRPGCPMLSGCAALDRPRWPGFREVAWG